MKTKLLKKIRRKYKIKKCFYRYRSSNKNKAADYDFMEWEIRSLKSKRNVTPMILDADGSTCKNLKDALISLLYIQMPILRWYEAIYSKGCTFSSGWLQHIPWMNEKNKKRAKIVLYIIYHPGIISDLKEFIKSKR